MWVSYQKRFRYAQGISFEDVIDTAITLIKMIQ